MRYVYKTEQKFPCSSTVALKSAYDLLKPTNQNTM